MARKTVIQDKGKIRGIRRRWLLNSVGVVALILASFLPNKHALTNGIICMVLGSINGKKWQDSRNQK